jgi:methylenetetrahydrofolate dehydrogenase (NADP+)/methenyltetrahydrofolate cyclohydrolase
MPTILSGLTAREELKKPLAAKIKALQEKRGFPLTLSIIQVGDRADSIAYINAKKKFAAEIGVFVRLIHLQEDTGQEKIIAEIQKLNQDKGTTGIIVQLPLPEDIDKRMVLDAIEPSKDTDGITSMNVKKWNTTDTVEGHKPWPATSYGVYQLLTFYKIPIQGKKVCVIGRSGIVGAPIAAILRKMGGNVIVCHSKTEDLMKETLAADIIISAVGKAGLVTAEHVRSGQVVIDVGLSRITVGEKTKLVGDVDFEKVSAVLGEKGAITPVPGGVGPMTVLALFENLADCAKL